MPDPHVVINGSLPVALAVAVLAGFVSFASPCVLPLVPGFLGYVTGFASSGRRPGRSRAVLGTALFVLGFSAVFVAGFASATAFGLALVEHQRLLTRIGGAVVIVLALVFLGFGERVGGQAEFKPRWRPAAGLVGAPLLGAIFALGWTPCTGPTLTAIYALTPFGDSAGSMGRAVVLAMAYSAGLGLPFVLLAAGWSRAERLSAWLRRHKLGVKRAGGALLLLIGVLLVSGQWEAVTSWLQTRFITTFIPVL